MLRPELEQRIDEHAPHAIPGHFAASMLHGMYERDRRVQNPELYALMRQFPDVEITPWLNDVNFRLVVATQAFDVQTVRLPTDTQMVRFHALPVVDFYVAKGHPFKSGAPVSSSQIQDGGVGLYCPRDKWFYCKNVTDFQIGILINGYAVGVECYVQN